MLEILENLLIVLLMVPCVIAIILGLIYLLGEFFNIISKWGMKKSRPPPSLISPPRVSRGQYDE